MLESTLGMMIGAIWLGVIGLPARPVMAQIIPDATLPHASVVLDGETGVDILGGTIAGSNLFHSFDQFVLRDGTRAIFVTPDSVDRILARVTGSAIADINGTLAANADLILLAPNGLHFGDRARLDLSGSFLATTAHAINFSDGLTWASIATDLPPLLSVNVPIGLQFDAAIAPGTITAIGGDSVITVPSIADNISNRLLSPNAVTSGTINATPSASLLSTAPGQTLSLIGGTVDLQRIQLDASSGAIVVGGVRSGRVRLGNLDQSEGMSLDFQAAELGGRIQLHDRAALTSRGFPNGTITLAAESIAIESGAFAQLQNFGTSPGGNLRLVATADISINGTPQDGQGSLISTETLSPGRGGDLIIITDRLNLLDGASANTLSYATGMAGNLNIVGDQILVQGFKPEQPGEISNINSTALAIGDGGDLHFRGRQLVLEDGGSLITLTTGAGRSGDIQVNMTEGVRLQGTEIDTQGSTLGTSTFNIGDAGNVEINAPQLSIFDGSRVGSLSVASGHAGNVTIHSPTSITLDNRSSIAGDSSIVSSTESITTSTLLPLLVQDIVPDLVNIAPTGDAGDLTITTPLLQVQNGGQIQVANRGFGDPGRLVVVGDTLRLDSGGTIAAETVTGNGSAIDLDLRLLEVDNGSIRTATVNTGQGSDIRIRASDQVLVTARSLQETGAQATGLFFSSADIPDFSIGIISGSAGAGKAGNIEIEAGELILRDGGLITPSALRSGDAGRLTIRTVGDIVIDGGILTTATISQGSDAGRGGDMTIEAENLALLDGGSISTTTLGRNNAGSLAVNVRDRLLIVGGETSNLFSVSGLSSGTLRLGSGSVGNGGELSISAQNLVLQNQGQISSSSEGLGNAGNINIDVETLLLDDRASIMASSSSGEGGTSRSAPV
ncbi:MAG: filamentous hemagglutinin N-terminal domain-containing protein [Coleofasciculaceae cyanobacterium RL_1_1]|nr:filamentous hemagglutinin N-terminal domain-containing protein [Coleofasciculaceae cyanobacterium RL_1_1]